MPAIPPPPPLNPSTDLGEIEMRVELHDVDRRFVAEGADAGDVDGMVAAEHDRQRLPLQDFPHRHLGVAVARGDDKAIDRIPAARRIVAEYEFPYLAHTPMEPLNATVRFEGNKAEAWVPSQFQPMDQMAIAEVLGLKPDQVTFHTEYAGGGFGRRAVKLTVLELGGKRKNAAVRPRRVTPVPSTTTIDQGAKQNQ